MLHSKLVTKVVQIFENERLLRLICDNNAKVIAVTIKHTLFSGLTITTKSPKFSLPQTRNISPGYWGFSHPKYRSSPLSDRKMDGERDAVLTQSTIVWTHRVRRPSCWLIETALGRSCYLPVHIVIHKDNDCAEQMTLKFQNLTRAEEVVITQLRIGHINATKSHTLSRGPPTACHHCGQRLTIDHMLLKCAVLLECRDEYYTVDSLNALFETIPETCIVEFVREVGFFYLMWCNLYTSTSS